MEPEMKQREWYGFTRYDFEFEGHKAFIVMPHTPAGDNRWNWCLEWPEAFVERCCALNLLQMGYYHVHVNIHGTFASPEGMAVLDHFYRYLTEERGFQKRAHLMGLSMGGLYSYRFAMEYPDRVAAIYGDAPVCDLACYPAENRDVVFAAYGCRTQEEIAQTGLNPIEHLDRLAAAGIPLINVYGCADKLVIPEEHSEKLVKIYRELGGDITVFPRPYVGHHPHGYDDTQQIAELIHSKVSARL